MHVCNAKVDLTTRLKYRKRAGWALTRETFNVLCTMCIHPNSIFHLCCLYRIQGSSDWFNSTELEPDVTSYLVDSLEPSQTYGLRILTRRTTSGRRKRADLVENVGISSEVQYLTCEEGVNGINCEQGRSIRCIYWLSSK